MIWLVVYWIAGTVVSFLVLKTPEDREKYGVAVSVGHLFALVLIFAFLGFGAGFLAILVDIAIGVALVTLTEKKA